MATDDTTPTEAPTETDTTPTHTTKTKLDEGPRTLSLGRILAYLVGAFSLVAGVATLFSAPVVGLAFVAAGVFVLPPTRAMLEDELRVEFSRWFLAVGYAVIIMAGGGLSAAV